MLWPTTCHTRVVHVVRLPRSTIDVRNRYYCLITLTCPVSCMAWSMQPCAACQAHSLLRCGGLGMVLLRISSHELLVVVDVEQAYPTGYSWVLAYQQHHFCSMLKAF
jgi:hypothetical protein